MAGNSKRVLGTDILSQKAGKIIQAGLNLKNLIL
jgi:hypothetical protein